MRFRLERLRLLLRPRVPRGALCLGIGAFLLVVSAAHGGDSPEATSAQMAADGVQGAVLRGTVKIFRKRPFRGLRESEDRSGALVYVTGFESPPPEEVAQLRQRNQQFDPRMLPIVAGQTVSFPNDDSIYHNVFSVSLVQPFDLGQYRSSEVPRTVSFETPGLVPVYCNIHPEMMSYVAVLENGAFAVTGEDGSFVISPVPAGRVTLNAWMPGAERTSRALDLTAGEVMEVDLELKQVKRTGPHRRKDGSRYPETPETEYEGG